MRVREPGVTFDGQPPHPFRTTDFARLVVERDQALVMKLCEVLSRTDFGNAEGAREGARALGTSRLEDVEDPVAAVRGHTLALMRSTFRDDALACGAPIRDRK